MNTHAKFKSPFSRGLHFIRVLLKPTENKLISVGSTNLKGIHISSDLVNFWGKGALPSLQEKPVTPCPFERLSSGLLLKKEAENNFEGVAPHPRCTSIPLVISFSEILAKICKEYPLISYIHIWATSQDSLFSEIWTVMALN